MDMATVTLDAFSGRPNLEWVLGQEQQAELRRRLAVAGPGPARPTAPPGLGYRGFVIHLTPPMELGSDLRVGFGMIEGQGRIRKDAGRSLERWLLETGRGVLDPDLARTVGRQIDER